MYCHKNYELYLNIHICLFIFILFYMYILPGKGLFHVLPASQPPKQTLANATGPETH